MTAPGAVLLVRTSRHIAMALKSAATLRTGPAVTVPVVEIIVCDKAVRALATDPHLAASIAAARGRGIHTRACGLSLERFGVAAATLPAGVDVVPNGLVETLRLQSLGFLSAEL
jgi:intracellular sulfur oxidation DsrE/DsrF family protein